MDNRQIKQIAIVCGGITGWMSAAYLAHVLGSAVRITLVETAACDRPNLYAATRPPFKALLATLGIPEPVLVAQTKASMSVGTQFVNWGHLGNRYMHPFGQYGADFDLVPLHQWWLKARAEDSTFPDLDTFSMAAAMARDLHFSLPSQDRQMVQSTFDYAFQMEALALADLFKAHALSLGVQSMTGEIGGIEIAPDSGHVASLTLDQGQTLAADLFIDCSGQVALLLQGALKAGFEDWSTELPCDRALMVETAKGGAFTPYSRISAREAGWQSRAPLQNKTLVTYCFASSLIDDEAALGALMDDVDGKALSDPAFVSFQNGRAKRAWIKNVVALGGAAGFLEPLEATGLHLVQSGLMRLLALWPDKSFAPLGSDEYNRITAEEWDSARDFLILHYCTSTRTDTPFWRARTEQQLTDSLATRIAHWRAFGRLIGSRTDVFPAPSWLSVYVGQGLAPDTYEPLVDVRTPQVDFAGRLRGLARAIEDACSALPSHQDWIDRHGRG